MSILFYRRPDYLSRSTGPVNTKDCQKYVERAKKSERIIPDGLSFDEIMNHHTLPPCTLNDFMDYLVYIEHNAENLQFFLWYKDYCARFEALPEGEKTLSPPFYPETAEAPDLSRGRDLEKEITSRRKKINRNSAGYDTRGAALFTEDKDTPSPHRPVADGFEHSFETPSASEFSSIPNDAEVAAQAGLKWQPFTIQPMREEINRIMRHYLAFTSPRELNLSHKDRALCLHALQHTTHPTALLPAVKITEAALRGQSHPNFIRWSICNGNRPRVFFVRTAATNGAALGFVLAIVLTLSRKSRWWRLFAAIIWFLGFSAAVAAYKGLCVIMHFSHSRALRPWEQNLDEELADVEAEGRHSTSSINRGTQVSSSDGPPSQTSSSSEYVDSNATTRVDSPRAEIRPASMKSFGPRNSHYEQASWKSRYERKSTFRKIFDRETYTQDPALKLLQDRIIIGANIWALIITIPLTVIFVALPKGNFYG